MREVFLYKCISCGNIKGADDDQGAVWYIDICSGCYGDWSNYEKVILGPAYDIFGVFQGHRFIIKEENDNKEEGKVDVNRPVD